MLFSVLFNDVDWLMLSVSLGEEDSLGDELLWLSLLPWLLEGVGSEAAEDEDAPPDPDPELDLLSLLLDASAYDELSYSFEGAFDGSWAIDF